MSLNKQFVDIDLEQEAMDHGFYRGLIEQSNEILRGDDKILNYEDVYKLIPESDWKETCALLNTHWRNCVREVKNQGREGSCVGNATTGAFQTRLYLLNGEVRLLSAMSLYKRIGRSAQSGAMVTDAIAEILNVGILPLSTSENSNFEHTHPATGFSNRLPSGWESTAKLFRVSRVLRVNTVAEWISALARGLPVVYGRKGHAIYSWIPVFEGNDLFFGYINSWGQWGDKINEHVGLGLGWDSKRLISDCVGYALDQIVVRANANK